MREVTSVLRRPVYMAVALVCGGGALAGCIYDADAPCGNGGLVVYGDNERCICPEDAVWTETGCVKCGKHEEPGGMECRCVTGYTRSDPSENCEKAPAGLGVPCSEQLPCSDMTYDTCHSALEGKDYCTKSGCKSSEDCGDGYACDSSSGDCIRPPVGFGKNCESDAECAGTEALYCDIFVTHSCMVQNCNLEPDDCFPGTECCDFTLFHLPNTCLPIGVCQQ